MKRRYPPVGLALAICTVALAPQALAQAENYFPLEPDWSWVYAQPGGLDFWTISLDGQEIVGGVPTTALREDIPPTSTPAQVVRNFWTRDVEGAVRLHGAQNVTDGVSFTYEPPLLMVQPPLHLGDFWTTTLYVRFSDDPDPLGPYDLTYAVEAEADVTVPAGVFHGWGIGQPLVLPPGAKAALATGHDLLGRRLGAAGAKRIVNDWFALEIGRVQFHFGDGAPWTLVDYSSPVPNDASSWGAVKNLYR